MFLDDAQQRTESWRLRHSPEAIAALGVWRWKGIAARTEEILALCAGKRIIDFGGHDGPLGFPNSIIVDAKAEHKSLDSVGGPIDVIFTSHTLEHLKEPASFLRQARERLEPSGHIIVHVPAWTCERWRAGQYLNPNQPNGHLWTFRLQNDTASDYPSNIWLLFIDSLTAQAGFTIQLAEYCGDNSIIIIGAKRG